jgi:hypothetical protein
MDLEDLLKGDESTVSEWLGDRQLVHECNCGYTVLDIDEVTTAVQDEWGDEHFDEIFNWACDLPNQFGWLDLESSDPKYDIYHCQYCAHSEFSFLQDLLKKTEGVNEPVWKSWTGCLTKIK